MGECSNSVPPCRMCLAPCDQTKSAPTTDLMAGEAKDNASSVRDVHGTG
jgi:hypothetical protein